MAFTLNVDQVSLLGSEKRVRELAEWVAVATGNSWAKYVREALNITNPDDEAQIQRLVNYLKNRPDSQLGVVARLINAFNNAHRSQ